MRQDVEKNRQLRSRIVQTLNVEEFLGGRKHCKGFSVRQDPLQGRTAHTKCGLYLLGPSLAAALHAERCILVHRGWVGENRDSFEHPAGKASGTCTGIALRPLTY